MTTSICLCLCSNLPDGFCVVIFCFVVVPGSTRHLFSCTLSTFSKLRKPFWIRRTFKFADRLMRPILHQSNRFSRPWRMGSRNASISWPLRTWKKWLVCLLLIFAKCKPRTGSAIVVIDRDLLLHDLEKLDSFLHLVPPAPRPALRMLCRKSKFSWETLCLVLIRYVIKYASWKRTLFV